ncbi:MAG: response regulator, partial [Desulforhopalus sp.]
MPGGRVRILFIDDDKFILELFGMILTSLGYDGVPAQNGRQALRILAESDDFRLILTDIEMPEMDGFELARRIKQLNPGIPIVALTGKDPETVLPRLSKYGISCALFKPFKTTKRAGIGLGMV